MTCEIYALKPQRRKLVFPLSWLYRDKSAKWRWIPRRAISESDAHWSRNNQMDGRSRYDIALNYSRLKKGTMIWFTRKTLLSFGPSYYSHQTWKVHRLRDEPITIHYIWNWKSQINNRLSRRRLQLSKQELNVVREAEIKNQTADALSRLSTTGTDKTKPIREQKFPKLP